MTTESHLVAFARDELTRAGMFSPDSIYGGMLGDAVMKMITLFAEEDHSGASASLATSLFSRVAAFQPLTPLTGEADEWMEVSDGVFQNKRCSTVFRDETGAYNIEGRVFREPSGACFTNSDSRVPVTFPYTPAIEYIDLRAA